MSSYMKHTHPNHFHLNRHTHSKSLYLFVFVGQVPGVTVRRVAAVSRDAHQARRGAGGRGQGEPGVTQRGAAHRPVHAGALVLTARPETLAALVHSAVVLARPALGFG